jgi:MoxR-like ATPase
MDTRPEDLAITPVLTGDKQIEYRASAVVTAMIRGGVVLLDEANRMPERSWASLAPLMDDRRYIESEVAALKIQSHSNFRLAVTMNADASVYELPGYIQSRLKPKIQLVNPPWERQAQIVRAKCPQVDDDLLRQVLSEFKRRGGKGLRDSTRDMLTLAQYAQKLRHQGTNNALKLAVAQVLEKAGE